MNLTEEQIRQLNKEAIGHLTDFSVREILYFTMGYLCWSDDNHKIGSLRQEFFNMVNKRITTEHI